MSAVVVMEALTVTVMVAVVATVSLLLENTIQKVKFLN